MTVFNPNNQDLQSVTDQGATTTNDISIASLYLYDAHPSVLNYGQLALENGEYMFSDASLNYADLRANSYIINGGTSSQFLKANGSLDSSTYLTSASASTAGFLKNNTGISGGTTLIGGTSTTDDLILQATSGAGTTGSNVIVKTGNNGAITAATFTDLGYLRINTVPTGQADTFLAVSGGTGLGTTKGVVSFRRDDAPSNSSTIGYLATFQRINSNTASWYLGSDTFNAAIIASNNADMRFGRDVAGTFTEYARMLNSNGNWGINEGTPGSKLSVLGGVAIGSTTAYSQAAAPTGGLMVEGNVAIGATTASYKLDVISNSIDSGIATRHSNLTQGIGIGYNTIQSIGTNTDVTLYLKPKGVGSLNFEGSSATFNMVDTASSKTAQIMYSGAGTTRRMTFTPSTGESSGYPKFFVQKESLIGTDDIIFGLWSNNALSNAILENYQGNNFYIQTRGALGTGDIIFRPNEVESMRLTAGGKVNVKTGTTSKTASVGGKIKDFITSVGNVGTGEDDLYTYTTEAGILAANGDEIDGSFGLEIVTSAGTATRQIKLWFGGTAIFDTTALLFGANSDAVIAYSFIRVSSTVIRYRVTLTTTGATLAAYTAVGELTGLTLSGTNIIKITGEAAGVGAATNDIVAHNGDMFFWPSAI